VTYAQFLLLFLVLPTALLLLRRPRIDRVHLVSMALLVVVAVAYTTPWDNYLVAQGVWGYGPGRVLATIGYVPVEEYLFFVLQPVLLGVWLASLRGWRLTGAEPARPWARWAGAAFWLACAGLGALILRGETLYLGLILVWAAPPLALQAAYGGDWLLARARPLGLAVAVPTLYFWAADRLAIGLGIWEIHTSVGAVLGLPVEEALFFLLTNVLVVQGLALARPVLAARQVHPRPAGRPAEA